ncbi:hypothetical protein OAQ99_07390, partial [Candidatus Kapabacteria bacterium]|nr:hypothetical protein [Candidatus Kapabacteria bacterium]
MIENNYSAQIEGEPEHCYKVFFHYLLMGEGRTVTALSKSYDCSRKHIYTLAKKYNWVERLRKADKYIADQNRQEVFEKYQNSTRQETHNLVDGYERVQKIYEDLIIKSELYIHRGVDEEQYFKRTNQFMNLMLKLQKFNFLAESQLKKFGLESSQLLDEEFKEIDHLNDEVENLESESNDDELAETFEKYLKFDDNEQESEPEFDE